MESGFTLYGEKKVQGDFERNINKTKIRVLSMDVKPVIWLTW